MQLNKSKEFDWLPLDVVSYSMLDSFNSCSVSWYLRYFCGVTWPMTDKMSDGTILQDALNLKYAGKEYLPKLKELVSWKRVQPLIEKLPELDNIISLDTPHFVDFDLGIPVKVTPDFFTKDKIIDAKFTGGYYNNKSVQNMLQLTIYKEGARRLFGLDTRLYYWIFNNKRFDFEEVEVTRTQKDTDNMLKWFKTTLDNIKKCHDSKNWIINNHTKYTCDLGRKACPILKMG